MGKTKINIVTAEGNKLAGEKKKLSYEEKRALRAEQKTQVPDSSDQLTSSTEARNPETGTRTSLKSPVKVERAGEVVESKSHSAETTRGKKYQAAKAKIETGKAYPIAEAAKLVKETSYSKFPGSVELNLNLDKDSFNSKIELPHSTGVSKKVEIATDETVEKLKTGKIDFDVLITTPQMMTKLVPFAKLLGPRGLMPNPKNGTLVDDPKKAVDSFGGKSVQLKTEKSAPLIHTVVAKTTQPEKEIEENVKAVFEAVGTKSIKKAVLSASMGPGIQVQVA